MDCIIALARLDFTWFYEVSACHTGVQMKLISWDSQRQVCRLPKALCFTADVFPFFYSPGYLRAPSADRRETLPHDCNMGVLYNVSPEIRRALPQGNWGSKTCKIRRDFRQLQTSIANVSGTGQDIQNRKTYWSRAIPPAFYGESPLTTEN